MRVQKLSFYTPRVVVRDLEEERGIGVLDEASQYLDCLKKNFCNVFGVPPSHSLFMRFPAVIHRHLPPPNIWPEAAAVPPRRVPRA